MSAVSIAGICKLILKIMKRIVLFLTITTVLFSCSTGKYAADYKQIKKSIDTLVVLSPMIVIDASDYNGKRIIDSELENNVRKFLTDKSYSLLTGKYVIESDFSNNEYKDENIIEFANLLRNIKQSKNPIQNLVLPNSIYQNHNTGKYFLFIYLKGHYTIGVSPYETLGNNSSINLTPAGTANEEVGVLLLNNNNELIYFNSIFSVNDPRLQELTERDFIKVIKSIYYK